MFILELFKSLLFGVVEGITEWLPISSTGHLILLDECIQLHVSTEFMDMYRYVIQLGAILAVLLLFFHKLNPFSPRKILYSAPRPGRSGERSCWPVSPQPSSDCL